jgi:hypothetical protein
MITKIVPCLILLLFSLIYSRDLDIDTSLVDKIVLSVGIKQPCCESWVKDYCISDKSDIQAFATSFSRAEQSSGHHDTGISFITKDNANYSKYHYYPMPKIHIRQDSIMFSYYCSLAVNKPNWYRYAIKSDKFDLFDTTLNYLKVNYNVDSGYSDKVKLTGHRIGFKTKDFIEKSKEYDFIDFLENIKKKPLCVSTDYHGPRPMMCCRNGVWQIMPRADIYFPCRNMYDLTETINYLHSIEGIEIEEVEIKNYFEIMFWIEINPDRHTVRSILYEESDEIKAKLKAAGITFSEINTAPQ